MARLLRNSVIDPLSAPLDPRPPLPIEVVVIDIDGTLCRSDGRLSPRVHRAVTQALQHGLNIILATGRRYAAAKPFAEALGLSGPIIVSGGSVVCDIATGDVLLEHVMTATSSRAAIESLQHAGLQPLLRRRFSLGHQLAIAEGEYEGPTDLYLKAQSNPTWLVPLEEFVAMTDVAMVMALSQDEPLLQCASDLINQIPDLTSLVLSSGPGILPSPAVNVFPQGTGKGNALLYLGEQMGFRTDSVMAIGDEVNDLEMLELVGFPVAVGNAIPQAKSLASAVVGSNDDDGVAEAIERFVLLTDTSQA